MLTWFQILKSPNRRRILAMPLQQLLETIYGQDMVDDHDLRTTIVGELHVELASVQVEIGLVGIRGRISSSAEGEMTIDQCDLRLREASVGEMNTEADENEVQSVITVVEELGPGHRTMEVDGIEVPAPGLGTRMMRQTCQSRAETQATFQTYKLFSLIKSIGKY